MALPGDWGGGRGQGAGRWPGARGQDDGLGQGGRQGLLTQVYTSEGSVTRITQVRDISGGLALDRWGRPDSQVSGTAVQHAHLLLHDAGWAPAWGLGNWPRVDGGEEKLRRLRFHQGLGTWGT